MTMETFPAEGVANPSAYLDALQAFQPGDAATVFTPGTQKKAGPSVSLLVHPLIHSSFSLLCHYLENR